MTAIDWSEEVELKLDVAELVVLFEMLDKLPDQLDELKLIDKAQLQMLWNLECVLEKLAPFGGKMMDAGGLEKAKEYLLPKD